MTYPRYGKSYNTMEEPSGESMVRALSSVRSMTTNMQVRELIASAISLIVSPVESKEIHYKSSQVERG